MKIIKEHWLPEWERGRKTETEEQKQKLKPIWNAHTSYNPHWNGAYGALLRCTLCMCAHSMQWQASGISVSTVFGFGNWSFIESRNLKRVLIAQAHTHTHPNPNDFNIHCEHYILWWNFAAFEINDFFFVFNIKTVNSSLNFGNLWWPWFEVRESCNPFILQMRRRICIWHAWYSNQLSCETIIEHLLELNKSTHRRNSSWI